MVAVHVRLFLLVILILLAIGILISYVILLYYLPSELETQMWLEVLSRILLLTKGNVCLDEYSIQDLQNSEESKVAFLELLSYLILSHA